MQVHRECNTKNDDAFFTLLSSQRELLCQLNKEQASRKSRTSSSGRNESASSLNQLVSEYRPGIDMILSKRFSLGMGNDNYVLPDSSLDMGLDGESKHSVFDPLFKDALMGDAPEKDALLGDLVNKDGPTESKRHLKTLDGDFEAPMKRKKRRLSSLGFLGPTFFEDHFKPTSRRSSLAFVSQYVTKDIDMEVGEATIESEIHESVGEGIEGSAESDQAKVDPAQAKSLMEAFRSAMEKSQKSQQSIHDWDRKMGLKRSHSKTMRLSTRSRKKLRTVFKNEISALAAKMA